VAAFVMALGCVGAEATTAVGGCRNAEGAAGEDGALLWAVGDDVAVGVVEGRAVKVPAVGAGEPLPREAVGKGLDVVKKKEGAGLWVITAVMFSKVQFLGQSSSSKQAHGRGIWKNPFPASVPFKVSATNVHCRQAAKSPLTISGIQGWDK
jgi:hypothetical protein